MNAIIMLFVYYCNCMVFYKVSWSMCGTVILQELFQLKILIRDQLYVEKHRSASLCSASPSERI